MIDAHQHFWRLDRGDYDWPNASVAPIFRDFLSDELGALLATTGVNQTVLVQATPMVAETEFLLDLASRTPFVAGVVGWVDLTAPDAIEQIDRLRADPKLKGLRPMLQSIEDTGWILQPAAADALRHMAEVGLRFDALIQPRHLGAITILAQRHPGLRIVIDHIAKPKMGNALSPVPAWAEGMAKAAELPNVWCKLSGMITEIGPGWKQADLAAHADFVLAHFGPDRLMWGSDWPVVTLAGDYAGWLATAMSLSASLGPAETARVFDGSAREFYGLAPLQAL